MTAAGVAGAVALRGSQAPLITTQGGENAERGALVLRTGVPDGAHAVVAAGRMLHSWQNIPRRSLLQLVSLLRHKFDWGGAMPSKRALRMCQQCHRDLCWRNSSYPGEIGRTVWNWYLCGRLMLY